MTEADSLPSNPQLVHAKLHQPGYFYIIQLEPRREPLRVKLGYTTDLLDRLETFLCVAPYARFLKAWRCKSSGACCGVSRTISNGSGCVSGGAERIPP